MNLGQTMITIGMFTLLMMTVISANRILIENAEAEMEIEALISPSVLASSLLDEILRKPFDQRVVIDTLATTWRQDTTGTLVTLESGLSIYQGTRWGIRNRITLPDSSYLGNYQSILGLRDVDDYDGYVRLVRSGTSLITFTVQVYYVTYTAPDVLTTSQQFFKKVNITVHHPMLKTNRVYSAIASY